MVFLSYISDDSLGTAGGTVHFLECAKRWSSRSDVRIRFLTTRLGAQVLMKHGLKQDCIVTSAILEGRTDTPSTILSWLSRCATLVRSRENMGEGKMVVLTESHLLPDAIASVALKRAFGKARIFTYLHHLIPSPAKRMKYHSVAPSLFGWTAQELSLLCLRMSHSTLLTYPSNMAILQRKGFTPSEIIPMSSGVDILAAVRGRPSSLLFDACYLGRLSPLKGVADLVKIWKLVCKSFPNAKLAIAGGGDEAYKRTVLSYVTMNQMEQNIIFLGWLSGEQKFNLLKSSKIMISASREEGWGIAICEAMACSLPVVAFDLESYRWAFEEGVIFAPLGDLGAFANSIVSLLRNEELRIELGKQAFKQSLKYDWNKIAEDEFGKISETKPGSLYLDSNGLL